MAAPDDREIRDPRMIAGIDLLRRTGMSTFRLGWSDEEDGPPTVWWACAEWLSGSDAGAGMTPTAAVMRLCGQVVDGGICLHCKRPTIFSSTPDTSILELSGGCVYAYDPELMTFRRACEGTAEKARG